MSSLESMKATLNQFASGGGTYWRLQTKRAVLRILPPIKGKTPVVNGKKHYFHAANQHTMKIDGGTRSFRCLHDLGKWCPVCAAAKIFAELGGKWEEIADDMKQQPKFSMNVIVRGEKGKIFIFQATAGVMKQLLEKQEGDWGDPSHRKTGWWFELSKKGTGKGTRYTVTPSPKGIGRVPKWVDLDDAHKLTGDFIAVKSLGSLRSSLIEMYSDQYPEIEDELRLSLRKWKKRRKKKAA